MFLRTILFGSVLIHDICPGQTADTRYRQKVVLVTHRAFHQCHHWRPLEGDRRCHQQGLRPEGPSPEGSRPGPPPRLCPEERHGCVSRPSALRPGRRTPPAQRNRKRTSKSQHRPLIKVFFRLTLNDTDSRNEAAVDQTLDQGCQTYGPWVKPGLLGRMNLAHLISLCMNISSENHGRLIFKPLVQEINRLTD